MLSSVEITGGDVEEGSSSSSENYNEKFTSQDFRRTAAEGSYGAGRDLAYRGFDDDAYRTDNDESFIDNDMDGTAERKIIEVVDIEKEDILDDQIQSDIEREDMGDGSLTDNDVIGAILNWRIDHFLEHCYRMNACTNQGQIKKTGPYRWDRKAFAWTELPSWVYEEVFDERVFDLH